MVSRQFSQITARNSAIERSHEDIKQSYEEEIAANDQSDNKETDETIREKDRSTDPHEIVPENVTESFSGQFDMKDDIIFKIVRQSTKHRNKIIEKDMVESGWTSKLAIFLFENTKVSCKFQFKHIWILNNGIVSTKGRCECKSFAEIKSNQNILDVEISNIDNNFKHTHKYQVRGEFKKNLAEKLKCGSALSVGTDIITDFIPDNESLPTSFVPVVPSGNALRILKHKSHKREGDTIDIILDWKENAYKNVITAVCNSPFYIFYRTKLQMAWYLTESKKRNISISIDATGCVVRPPPQSQKMEGSDKLKHVFLYSIMAKGASKSVPIAQMITQDQSSEFIGFFLEKTFKNQKSPREVVCDESKALLKAITKTFTNCYNVENYISTCMSSLLNGTAPPICSMRIDRSHFVKNITRKIKHKDTRKRNFFRYVIGYLIQCDCFLAARNIILDFFTLILNENHGNDELGVELPAESAKKRLLSLISSHDAIDYTDDVDGLESDDSDNNLNYDADVQWIEEIIRQVTRNESKSCHDNLYFSPDDEAMFVKIFSSIVLWSNVTNSMFSSTTLTATSSDVESYFKSLKSGILRRKMLSADEFLENHMKFINAEIKLNAQQKNIVSDTNRKRRNSLDETSPITKPKKKRSNSMHENISDEIEQRNDGKFELNTFVGSVFHICHYIESIYLSKSIREK